MSEQENNENNTPEATVGASDDGTKSKATEEVERLNEDTERINKAIADNDNAKAREKLAGVSTLKQPKENKEETDKEYRARINKELAEGKTDFGN